MPSFPSLTPSNRKQRRLLFLLSVGLLLVAGLSVIDLLATAWGHRPWGIARHALRGAMNVVGVSPTFFYYFPLGVFLGLVIGLLLDSFKTLQGGIIAAVTLLAIPLVFIPRGVFIGPLATSFGPNTVLAALVAAAATLRAGGVTLDSLDSGHREYPRIPALIFWLTALLVTYGFFEAHLAYQSPIVVADTGFTVRSFAFERVVAESAAQHFVGAVVLLPALRYFTTYERGMHVIMLGPKRSGKSAVFGGLHLYIRDNVDEDSEAANRVSTLRRSIENKRFPDPTPTTVQSGADSSQGSQPMLLELPYAWGRFVPTRVRFSVVDYPGEALEGILEEVVETALDQVQGGDNRIATDGGDRDASEFDIPFSDSSDDDGEDDSESSTDDESSVEWDTAFDEGDAADTGGRGRDADGSGGDVGAGDRPAGESGGRGDADSGVGGPDGRSQAREFDDASNAGSSFGGTPSDDPFGSGGVGGVESDGSLFEESDTDDEPDTTPSVDPKSSWEAATRTVREAQNLAEMIPGIRGCIHNADRIVLTLPLDDFVAPVIERGNVPSYLRDRVVTPEELDDYRRSEIRPIQYQGRTYAVKGPNRDDVEDYLFWYEAIRSVYPEKDIVIVGTMADWMIEDFKANHDSTAAVQADGYREFCDYVRDEIVREQTPGVNQLFGGRRDPDPLYLLWYDIENEEPAGTDELRINVSGPSTVLKGARQFMQRINQ